LTKLKINNYNTQVCNSSKFAIDFSTFDQDGNKMNTINNKLIIEGKKYKTNSSYYNIKIEPSNSLMSFILVVSQSLTDQYIELSFTSNVTTIDCEEQNIVEQIIEEHITEPFQGFVRKIQETIASKNDYNYAYILTAVIAFLLISIIIISKVNSNEK
jgi:hypothetical protein